VRTKLFLKAVCLSSLCFVLPIQAEIITASGAGPLPASAQDITGHLPTEIIGTLPDTPDAVSLFKFVISDAADFSAITLAEPFGIPDTELFLFDAGGFGVYANDDIDGGNTLSCLPSADISNPCSSSRPAGIGPISSGVYYLAITRSANLPLSATGNIFTILNFTDVVGPDLTIGGNNLLNGWDGGAFTTPDTDLVKFDIVISGAVPEPSTGLLAASVIVILALFRRKSLAR